MKTLNQYIQEKLIVNKNYKSVSYDFNNAKELYLIRFIKNNKSKNYIIIDIINVESIIIKDDNDCILNGDFRISSNTYYLNHVFKCDSTNGTLYRDDGIGILHLVFCDVLIHESLKGNFKKFVEYISKNPHETYSVNDIFDILNIKCPEFENKYKKVKYDRIDNVDDPIFMDKLKKIV